MRLAWLYAAVVVCLPAVSHGHDRPAAVVLHVASGDVSSLKRELLALAQERLPTGLVVDSLRAELTLSAPLPAADTVEARPAWLADSGVPPLPLAFELVSKSSSIIHAALAVRLLREVPVAARRLRKGSAVTCSDLATQLRDVRTVPQSTLERPCQIAAEAVTLRDLAAGDIVRSADIGRSPDVSAGMPVRVSVSNGSITVSTSAIALADAQVGDQVDVRLPHPMRILKARVTARGSVQLAQERS